MIADDVTPEAMVSRLAENDGRLALMSAEGGTFATFAGRYANGVANLDALLKGYSGDPIRVERKGREAEIVDRPALTVCLATQPDVLAAVCADERFRGQGLLARIAFAQPRPMVGHRDPDAAVPTPEHVAAAYAAALSDLTRGLYDREHGPTSVKFSPAAREEIAELQRRVERRLTTGGDLSGDLEAWGGKHVGRVVRVALLLHMAEHGCAGVDLTVDRDTVAAAERIGEFFAAHTRAAFGTVDTGEVRLSDLTTTLDYLRVRHQRRPLAPFTMRELSKSGPTLLRRKSIRDQILATLADLNIVVTVRRRTESGRLGAHVVYLHPKAA
nr:YfjI family protein [Gordonia sp. NB41Y]